MRHHVVDLIGLLGALARADRAVQPEPASAASIISNTTSGSRPASRSVSARSPEPLATQVSLILPPRPWSISTLTACCRSP